MKLIALTNIKFKGERIAQGFEFDAAEKESAALIADGLAEKPAAGKRGSSKGDQEAAAKAAAEAAQARKEASDAIAQAESALQGAEGPEAAKAAQGVLDAAKAAFTALG
jgi:hypothetical protein